MKKRQSKLTAFQILYTFAKRMEELQQRKYFNALCQLVDLSKDPREWEKVKAPPQPGKITYTLAAINDEEQLISFLAVFRQFCLKQEPIHLDNIRQIVTNKAQDLARAGDTTLLADVERLAKKHSVQHGPMFQAGITDRQGNHVGMLDEQDLDRVFLYGKYFHSNDYIGLRFHFELDGEHITEARAAFEYNLRYKVAELLDWHKLVIRLLNTGVFTH